MDDSRRIRAVGSKEVKVIYKSKMLLSNTL